MRRDHNQTGTSHAARNPGTTRLSLLRDDPGIIKSVPSKRSEALTKIFDSKGLVAFYRGNFADGA